MTAILALAGLVVAIAASTVLAIAVVVLALFAPARRLAWATVSSSALVVGEWLSDASMRLWAFSGWADERSRAPAPKREARS